MLSHQDRSFVYSIKKGSEKGELPKRDTVLKLCEMVDALRREYEMEHVRRINAEAEIEKYKSDLRTMCDSVLSKVREAFE